MAIRFFDPRGQVSKGRRSPCSDSVSSFDSEATGTPEDIQRLSQVIRDLLLRVSKLEASQAPDAVEFDVTIPASGTVSLAHSLNSPTRWYIVSWRKASAVSPILAEVGTSSDLNTLVLTSGASGQAVIRIEKSQFGQSFV